MEEFSGDVDDDDEEDDLDEVDRYIITKILFSKDDTILEWWNKHSLTFPQLFFLECRAFFDKLRIFTSVILVDLHIE
jgi:hypothetical protein